MRITFKYLQQVAESKGFICEPGPGRTIELDHNELARGITAVYASVSEAWSDIYKITQGINPLNGKPLPK